MEEARVLLGVHSDQYDGSIRHTVVKEALEKALPDRGITNLPLAVKRREDNPEYVTWTGTNTILGGVVDSPRFTLSTEMRVTKLIVDLDNPSQIVAAKVRDLKNDCDIYVIARVCDRFDILYIGLTSGHSASSLPAVPLVLLKSSATAVSTHPP